MKAKLGALLTTPALLAATLLGSVAPAQASAYTTKFTSSVTYQNIGTGPTTVNFAFYPRNNGTPIRIAVPLNANAGASLFVGNVKSMDAFSGAGVITAGQPVVGTMVQSDLSNEVRNRPLSDGFRQTQGNKQYLISTVLKHQYGNKTNTKFMIQNVDRNPVNVTINFYKIADASGSSADPVYTKTLKSLPAGAVEYIDAANESSLPDPFNGSAVIQATGPIVASALELVSTTADASSFEGVTGGSDTVYMPSALCNAFGGQTTYYAVQNVETDPTKTANVTVKYSDGVSVNRPIAPGAKTSFNTCDDGFSKGVLGSAVISSTGGKIVAIGKVAGVGLYTAFVGITTGSSKLAVPYVRFTQSRYDTKANYRQRTYMAIQNVGSSDLPAGDVTVTYVDPQGNIIGTHTLGAIAQGKKANSTAPEATGDKTALNEFGYFGTSIGGSAVVQSKSGGKLVVVARVTSNAGGSSQVGEDYNGIPMQ